MSGQTWTADEIAAATRAAVKVQGCTCAVELEVHQDDDEGQMFHITAHHDDWCPLLNARQGRWN